jgi:hypothetical protein
MDRPHENAIATGAPQDCSHWSRIRTQRAYAFYRAACLTLRLCDSDIASEKFLKKGYGSIAFKREIGDVFNHDACPPEGPKRSVFDRERIMSKFHQKC